MTDGTAEADGRAETIVSGCPTSAARGQGHCLRRRGGLYINVGAPSNACQRPGSRPGVKGADPCPILEKHARHLEVRREQAGQTQDQGTRFATGLRQMPAITWHDDALYIAMNNRDQLDVFWPELFTRRTTPSVRPSRSTARCRGRTSAGRTATTTSRPRR
jgi:glucose/arabinose dehydrogenase